MSSKRAQIYRARPQRRLDRWSGQFSVRDHRTGQTAHPPCSAMIARSCPARPCTDHHAVEQWPGGLLLRCSQSQAEPPQLAGAIHELLHAGGVRREMPWPPSLVSGRRLTPRVGTPGNDEPRSGRQSMPARDVPTRRDAAALDVLRRGQRPAQRQQPSSIHRARGQPGATWPASSRLGSRDAPAGCRLPPAWRLLQ